MPGSSGTGLRSPEDESDHLLGQVLDSRYQILSRMNAGAMGVLYRARQISAERDVVVKLLSARWRDHQTIVKRFENEARIIARLRHPNILKLIDTGRMPDGSIYLVTELIEGKSLSELIHTRRHDAEWTAHLLAELAGGLEEPHSLGVVHRDLKPANVMIEVLAGRLQVKILDFGIARIADAALTLTNMTCGTPGYMSPEQMRGELVDARSDLYALGVIGYECLAGRPLFSAASLVELMMLHESTAPPPLALGWPPGGPEEELGRLLLQLLEKDRGRRPASARALLATLEQIRERLRSFPVGPEASPEEAATAATWTGNKTLGDKQALEFLNGSVTTGADEAAG